MAAITAHTILRPYLNTCRQVKTNTNMVRAWRKLWVEGQNLSVGLNLWCNSCGRECANGKYPADTSESLDWVGYSDCWQLMSFWAVVVFASLPSFLFWFYAHFHIFPLLINRAGAPRGLFNTSKLKWEVLKWGLLTTCVFGCPLSPAVCLHRVDPVGYSTPAPHPGTSNITYVEDLLQRGPLPLICWPFLSVSLSAPGFLSPGCHPPTPPPQGRGCYTYKAFTTVG